MTQEEFFNRYHYNPDTDRIGRGGFGSVYKAYDTVRKRYVAIKESQVDVHKFTLQREVELSHEIAPHPNIAKFENCYRFTAMRITVDYAVMEYYPDGSLSDLIGIHSLSEVEKWELINGILQGVAHLHNQGIIHRDLKSGNILVKHENGHWIPKITDFGLSRIAETDSSISNSSIGISYAFATPEQIKGCSTVRKNLDLWSVGTIIYHILTGNLPFIAEGFTDTNSANIEICRKIVNRIIPDDFQNLPQMYKAIIERCWVVDVEKLAQKAEEILEMMKKYSFSTSEYFDGSKIFIAQHISDSMTFEEAFAVARQEVGAGGIFKWHGAVYGTYYANEWNEFSDDYKHKFSNYPYAINKRIDSQTKQPYNENWLKICPNRHGYQPKNTVCPYCGEKEVVDRYENATVLFGDITIGKENDCDILINDIEFSQIKNQITYCFNSIYKKDYRIDNMYIYADSDIKIGNIHINGKTLIKMCDEIIDGKQTHIVYKKNNFSGFKKCPNGHLYLEDLKACPYCPSGSNTRTVNNTVINKKTWSICPSCKTILEFDRATHPIVKCPKCAYEGNVKEFKLYESNTVLGNTQNNTSNKRDLTHDEFLDRYQYNPDTDRIATGIYKAYDTIDKQFVVIKESYVNQFHPDLQHIVEYAQRIGIHANLAKYEAGYRFGGFDYAIMKYYPKGNLAQLMKNNTLTFEQKHSMLIQILEGIDFLHNNNIILQNLNPENILIEQNGNEFIPKISNYGINWNLVKEDPLADDPIPPIESFMYNSPEQLRGEEISNKNTDLWSFGVIAFQMLTEQKPFITEDQFLEFYKQIRRGTLPMEINTISGDWNRLIKYCLITDPSKRIANAREAIHIVDGKEAIPDFMVNGTNDETKIE